MSTAQYPARARVAAWAVHILTMSGLVWASLAMLTTINPHREYTWMWVWLLVALVVEQTQVDTGGGRGVEGAVRSRAVIGRPEWVGVARPDLALGALLRFRCGLRRRCCRRGHGDYPATTEVRRQESGRKTCHVGASPGTSPGADR